MTSRKVLLALVLMVFAAGWSFAQTAGFGTLPQAEAEKIPEAESEPAPIADVETETAPEPQPKPPMPKNTITVDFGPTIIGLAIGGLGNTIGEDGFGTSGFGIAAQYERQVLDNLGIAGRFAWLNGGAGINAGEEGLKAVMGIDFYSFSIEGHARFYPWAKTFFLDGMLGYANLRMKVSGEAVVEVEDFGEYGGYLDSNKKKESVSFDVQRSYLKLGGKIGWRIDFGKPGGFIFEPSMGWYAGIGLTDTLGKKFSSSIKKETGEEASEMQALDPVFFILEQIVFVGGPRVCLSFGWRF